jgi:hypothetical protein
MENKDKFRINATIFGNDIDVGFEMPEWSNCLTDTGDYFALFANRYSKCFEAFCKAVEKINDERNAKNSL